MSSAVFAKGSEKDDYDTPVQILDISQSEFSLSPKGEEYFTLTLVNTTEEDKQIEMHVVDAVDPELGIYQEIDEGESEFGNFLMHEDLIEVKARGILQVPLSLEVPKDTESNAYYGAILLSELPKSDNVQPLDVRVIQPLKVIVQGDWNIGSSMSFLLYPLLALIAIAVVLLPVCYGTFVRGKYEYFIVSAVSFVVIVAFFVFNIISPGGFLSSSFLGADILSGTPDVEIADLDEAYEYESDDGVSYLELHATAIDGEEITDSDVFVGYMVHSLSESLAATLEVAATVVVGSTMDVFATIDVAATPAIQAIGSEALNAVTNIAATLDVDLSELEEALIESFSLDIQKIPWLHPDYNGSEVPILYGVHLSYKGLELGMKNMFLNTNINKKLIKKQTKKILSLTDDGEARNFAKAACYEIKGKNYDEVMESPDEFITSVTKLIKLDHPDTKRKHVKNIFSRMMKNKKKGKVLLSQAKTWCNNFRKAHDQALKLARRVDKSVIKKANIVKLLVKRQGSEVPEVFTVFTNLKINNSLMDLVANYPATGDAQELIRLITNKYQFKTQVQHGDDNNNESDEQDFTLYTEDLLEEEGLVCAEDETILVEIKWGDIGKNVPKEVLHTSWNGSVKAKKGTLFFKEAVKFDKNHDKINKRNQNIIEWDSRIKSHFDGFLFEYLPKLNKENPHLVIKNDFFDDLQVTPEEIASGLVVEFDDGYSLSIRQVGCDGVTDDYDYSTDWVCEESEVAKFKMRWGDIDNSIPKEVSHTHWNGHIEADGGALFFKDTVKFDNANYDVIVTHDQSRIEWNSRVKSHWDGILFEYLPDFANENSHLDVENIFFDDLEITLKELTEGVFIEFDGGYKLAIEHVSCDVVDDSSDNTDGGDSTDDGDGDEGDGDGTDVTVDLEESRIIEMILPDYIYVPPILADGPAYYMEADMGEFQLEAYNPEEEWQGYFSFEVVQLSDGRELDDLWLDINGNRIEPIEHEAGGHKYIHFYVSKELFPYVETGTYHFSPDMEILIPEFASPGTYDASLFFTMIQ